MSFIVIIIAVLLILSAMSDSAAAKDWETSEELAEMRHQELMDLEREHHKELKKELKEIKKNQKKKSLADESFVNRKRYIKDRNGNVIAEEVLVSRGKDYSYDDYDDDYEDEFDDEEYDDLD